MNKKMNNKGFSLVELIIVIAIMAILIGVLAPMLYKYVEKSRESTDITNLDTCVNVVQAYYADQGIPSGGITITGAHDSNFVASPNDALTDANADKSAVKGAWTITATIAADGTITYTDDGNGKYYKVDGNKFVPK
ncbi:MAG: type II secretion system protein [Lachnospiraceae bacterium]|nr:type II secretion system protein [Lachnospiraceae bacterium]